MTARGDQLLCAGEIVGVEMSYADQQVLATEEDAVLLTFHRRLHGRENGQSAATLPNTRRSLRQGHDVCALRRCRDARGTSCSMLGQLPR